MSADSQDTTDRPLSDRDLMTAAIGECGNALQAAGAALAAVAGVLARRPVPSPRPAAPGSPAPADDPSDDDDEDPADADVITFGAHRAPPRRVA